MAIESTFCIYKIAIADQTFVNISHLFRASFSRNEGETRGEGERGQSEHTKMPCTSSRWVRSIHASDTAISDWPDYMPVNEKLHGMELFFDCFFFFTPRSLWFELWFLSYFFILTQTTRFDSKVTLVITQIASGFVICHYTEKSCHGMGVGRSYVTGFMKLFNLLWIYKFWSSDFKVLILNFGISDILIKF